MCISSPCFDTACRFIVVHPCFTACDDLLQESLSFTVLLQTLHACFQACLFVLICKLIWHPPYINFLWHPRSSWMMVYADSQVMSNFLALSVTVIHLYSQTRVLTHSTLSTICKVVRQPKQLSTTPVLPFSHLSTPWYTFLCIIVFCILC